MIAGILEIQMMANIARLSDDMRRAERVVGDSMGKVERSVANAKRALSTLGLGLSFGLLADQARRMSDAYVNMDAQLRLSTKSQEQYNRALADVRRISSIAQSDISSTIALYTRLLNSTEGTGISQRRLSTITETVSYGLKAFGASSAEAASAQLQLSQAIGSGKLGGDEFRALMESMPNVMKVLAKSMGVPLGGLKALATEGKITTAEMVKAFGDPKIAAEFKRMAEGAQTITGAWTVARNELILMFGEFTKSSGLTQGMITAFNGLAGALKVLGQYLNDIVMLLGAWAALRVTQMVYGYVAALMASRAAALAAAQAELIRVNMTYGASAATVAAARTSHAYAAANTTLGGSLMILGQRMGAFVSANAAAIAITGLAVAAVALKRDFDNAVDSVGKFQEKIRGMEIDALRAARQLEVANVAAMKSSIFSGFNERDILFAERRIRMMDAQIVAAEKLAKAEKPLKSVSDGKEHQSRMLQIAQELQAQRDADTEKMSNSERVSLAWAKLKRKDQTAQEALNYVIAQQAAIELDNLKAAEKAAETVAQSIIKAAKSGDVGQSILNDIQDAFEKNILEPQIKAVVLEAMPLFEFKDGALVSNTAALQANTAALGGQSGASSAGGVGGAAVTFWALFAVVAVKAYRSLTKEQEIRTTGISGTVTAAGIRGGEYTAIERVASGVQQLFGDNGSYTRTIKEFSAQQQLQLNATFGTVKSNVTQFAEQLGLSTSALETFAMTFDIVGGSFATLAGQITDQMAYALLGVDYAAAQKSIMQAYTQELLNIVVGGGQITSEVAASVWDRLLTSALNAQLPAWFKDLQRAGESVGDTLVRVTTEIKTVDKMWSMLGFNITSSFGAINTALGGVAGSSILAREALIEAMGGIDSFTSIMSSFYDKFYTQAEKVSAAQNNLNAGFSELGIGIPSSYAAFRELLAGLDLTTESGRSTYSTLIGLADAFATVQSASDALAKTNLGWQQKINVLLGTQTQQQVDLENALVGVDDSTAALIRRYYALQEAQASTTKAYTDAVSALGKVKKFAVDVRAFMDSLWGGAMAPMAMNYGVLFQKFAQINAQAAAGDVAAQGKLQGAATTFLESAKRQASSALDYARSFGMIQAGLEATASSTEDAVSQAEQTLQAALSANEFLQRISASSADTVNSLDQLRALLVTLGMQPSANLLPFLPQKPEYGIMPIGGVMPPILRIPSNEPVYNTMPIGGTPPPVLHAFANGGAFTNGIYGSPTPFMFADGAGFSAGVMGEAGDEAVMPLKRGPDGRLGVSMHGGGGNVAAEVRMLRDEVNMLRRDNQAGQVAIATAAQRTYKVIDRWNGEGMPEVRIA